MRLERAEVVQSSGRDTDQVFFGAAVRVRPASGGERTVIILGVDETDPARGVVSWISPIARALLKAREGDVVTVRTPAGEEKLEILEVTYP
jgi:transcription elongation factor GreB